ncbi:hypothetical protein BT96DRAFT_613086 [Gymnopus androsaceus JB14]|uniref:Uncharacterized protein n=1 Tax=Gymnopus androsaceus JB14 TaxID=1447944 RepID=A0A6A4HVD9_9AGAR|nr:hypothetical protein BT96DRAFT_613086 [Gymnopus androsaceus JB14]
MMKSFGPTSQRWEILQQMRVTPSLQSRIHQRKYTAGRTSIHTLHGSWLHRTWTKYSRWGIWALQTAFESEKPLERELAAIRLACLWLIYDADRLWENVNGRDNNGKDVGCGKRFQGRKWKGFSRDRWSFWEERLLQAQVI